MGETNADLRRLVETQAATIRELAAQRDALRTACDAAAGWLNCRGIHYAALGSEDVARGLFQRAHALESAIAATKQ